jgi:hypothetical protein
MLWSVAEALRQEILAVRRIFAVIEEQLAPHMIKRSLTVMRHKIDRPSRSG